MSITYSTHENSKNHNTLNIPHTHTWKELIDQRWSNRLTSHLLINRAVRRSNEDRMTDSSNTRRKKRQNQQSNDRQAHPQYSINGPPVISVHMHPHSPNLTVPSSILGEPGGLQILLIIFMLIGEKLPNIKSSGYKIC